MQFRAGQGACRTVTRAHEVYSVVRNAPAKAGAAAPVVAGKLRKLLDDGATVVSEAESINGVWTAVCASTGAAFRWKIA